MRRPAATRVAMIGCGFFAQNHLNAWKDLAAERVAELVAVCDRDSAKAAAASKAFGAPAFTEVGAMLSAARPDLVDIATQMGGHREICAAVGGRGVAAIVQKPLAPSWADCLAIAATAREQKAFLAVHENFRFQAPMLRVKQLIDEGAIGTPNWARIAFRTGYDVYANQPYFYGEERLAILDVGIHVIDLARVFLGEVERVSCETQRRNPKVRAEDTATLMLRHRSGAVSVIECTYEARRIPDVFPQTLMEIEGDRGSIMLLPDERLRITSNSEMLEEVAAPPMHGWMTRPWHLVQHSVYATNKHILERFRAGAPADVDIEDNLKTYAIVEAAYAAAAEHRAHKPPA